jgi:hypothetical protein
MLIWFIVPFLLAPGKIFAFNFPYEGIQLQRSEIGNNSDIDFGNGTSAEKPLCKSFPGYESWPSAGRWSVFNASLEGALLRAIPPAATCYEGEFRNASTCNAVRQGQGKAIFA